MKILGIETSCDETAAAVIEAKSKKRRTKIITNIVSSSLTLHSKTGGIIPEIAARKQIEYIISVLEKSIKSQKIDAIAVTIGPGLIGSLLVGVETGKTLSFAWKKPLVPVNHLLGHIYANWTGDENEKIPEFPAIALIVSGGHTDLVLMKNHGKIKLLGGTLDDAAGEAFDKIGRLLQLPYPGGPSIEKIAKNGSPKRFIFPRPMLDSQDLNFSFSGLKTAVFREIQKIEKLDKQTIADIAAEAQQAIVDVLTKKTIKAVEKHNVKSVLLCGGVSANQKLRNEFEEKIKKTNSKFFVPPKNLSTDNAAIIATAAFYNYKEVPFERVTANQELYFK